MAETDKNTETLVETMRKKQENESKPQTQNDEDSESAEEQPLDIGEHYLVRRSGEVWRKFVQYNLKIQNKLLKIDRFRSCRNYSVPI